MNRAQARLLLSKSNRTLHVLGAFVILALPITIALFYDIHRDFSTTTDADFWFVYEVLRLNGGLPQWWGDHPGYTLFVLLAWWFKFLHFLGLMSVHAIGEFPSPRSQEFVDAYANAVFAARYFSAAFSALFAVVFFGFLRYLTRDFWVSVTIGTLFATFVSLADFALFIRTDQPAAFFSLLTFIVLIVAARSDDPWRVAVAMFACGSFAVIAMLAKVISAPGMLAFPVLVLFFGTDSSPALKIHAANGLLGRDLVLLAIIAAAAFAVPAVHIIVTSIQARSGDGIYQSLIVLYVLGAMCAYAWLYRTGWESFLLAGAGLVAGIAAGCYFALLYPPPHMSLNAISNFIEQLYFGISLDNQAERKGLFSWAVMFEKLPYLLERFVRYRIFGFNVSSVLNPLILAGVILAWKRDSRATAYRVMALLTCAMGIEFVLNFKHIDSRYEVFGTVWKIVALAKIAAWIRCEYGDRIVQNTLTCIWLPVFALNLFIIDSLADGALQGPLKHKVCGDSKQMTQEFIEGFERYCE